MIAALHRMQADFDFELEIVDVDSDPELERRYGEKVPVLACGDDEICHYRLEPAVVTEYLTKIC